MTYPISKTPYPLRPPNAAAEGSDYTVLHHFAGGVADGRTPDAALVEGRDGLLYSSTISGGAFDAGTLYRVSKDGSHFELLHHFTASGETGYHPNEGLVAAHDGALYGSAPGGHGVRDPKREFGFIFRLGHQLGFSWNGSQALLVATGIAGYTYAIQHSSDLAAWATLETVVMPEGGQFEKDYAVPQGNTGFFRLRVP